MTGWIKLHRSIQDWQWYDDKNCVILLVHLLVTVNYEEKKWHGITIQAGSRISSWDVLSKETRMTVQQVRTAMAKLEKSGEVTRKATNKHQLISLVKWDKLQGMSVDENKQDNKQTTGKQQTINIPLTTTKEVKEKKKEKKFIHIPSEEEFLKFGLEKKPNVDQDQLKMKYQSWLENDWKDGNGKPVKNWKAKLLNTLPYLKTNNDKGSDRMAAIANF